MAQILYFPESMLALNEEVQHHPKLQELMSQHDDMETKLAEIAAYCGIVLDGYYSGKDLEHLAHILTMKLRQARQLVWTPSVLRH